MDYFYEKITSGLFIIASGINTTLVQIRKEKMLTDPPIEKLLPKVENRYILAMLTAKRARQLVDGAQALSERRSHNYITQASMELEEDRVVGLRGEHEVVVPLRPDVEAERLEAMRQARQKDEEAMLEEARLAESSHLSAKEKRAAELAKTEAMQDQHARDFTAQLLEIIAKQDDERARN